ncbi:hypothetical protein D4R99_03225 [bacterium]|nr:MAG: hypothetical protein D4R99_03225 [bacterium]
MGRGGWEIGGVIGVKYQLRRQIRVIESTIEDIWLEPEVLASSDCYGALKIKRREILFDLIADGKSSEIGKDILLWITPIPPLKKKEG